jgi:hypothetical protein
LGIRLGRPTRDGGPALHDAGARTSDPLPSRLSLRFRECCALRLVVAFLALGQLTILATMGRAGGTNAPAGASSSAATNGASPSAEKPLLLGDDKPLLLDDDNGANALVGGADNSRCQVCHLNFMQEALTVGHAKTNIGCATCHGACDAHIADESWASGGNGTAPDIMFPRARIYAACIACHKPEQVFVKIEKHQAFWWTIAYQEKVCTECHGQHRMVSRKCKWK